MGYLDMYTQLDKHADRISRGDKDLKQNILCLSYTTYCSAFSRRYELSIGELVNFMQLKAGELRSCKLRHFGNRGHRGSKDVYSRLRYYKDDVKLLHFSGSEGTDDVLTGSFHRRNIPLADDIAFKIDFKNFLTGLSERDRSILIRRMEGYQVKELSSLFNSSPSTISKCLRRIGREITISLNIPKDLAISFGVA
ncbi:MAG: sigma-70 family RNA polymerase sigma factor [Candidatus Marinimicrobia bacterium]|nr:sigma-70 family RNA polymerase sigma factor [Candidatus Neomarinimicrobiota bacterium]